jgi:hypothetical protein
MRSELVEHELSEARESVSHWFHGMRVVDDVGEWARYGYIANKNGDPVRDPDKLALSTARYQQHEMNQVKLSQAQADPTVGDMAEKVKFLESSIARMELEHKKDKEQVRSEVATEEKARASDEKAVRGPGRPKKASV